MGLLASTVRKAMKEHGVRQIDIPDLTGGIVPQSTLSYILSGKLIPDKLPVLDALADALKKDRTLFRRLAAKDKMSEIARVLSIDFGDLCEAGKRSSYRIPYYRLSNLKECLSPKGYQSRKTDQYIEIFADYGPYAYAVEISDLDLGSGLPAGEILIASPDHKVTPLEDYAIVGTKDEIIVGRTRIVGAQVVVESVEPYVAKIIKKHKIAFMHKIVAVSRILLPKSVSVNKP